MILVRTFYESPILKLHKQRSLFFVMTFCRSFFTESSSPSIISAFIFSFSVWFSCLSSSMMASLFFANWSASFTFLSAASIFPSSSLCLLETCVSRLVTFWLVSWSRSFNSFSWFSIVDSLEVFLPSRFQPYCRGCHASS